MRRYGSRGTRWAADFLPQLGRRGRTSIGTQRPALIYRIIPSITRTSAMPFSCRDSRRNGLRTPARHRLRKLRRYLRVVQAVQLALTES